MNRTNELLKDLEINKQIRISYNNQLQWGVSQTKIDLIKSEIKGRLSILKEMKEFLENLKRKEFTDNLDICCYPREFYEKLEEINNEIKLIEEGVGK